MLAQELAHEHGRAIDAVTLELLPGNHAFEDQGVIFGGVWMNTPRVWRSRSAEDALCSAENLRYGRRQLGQGDAVKGIQGRPCV